MTTPALPPRPHGVDEPTWAAMTEAAAHAHRLTAAELTRDREACVALAREVAEDREMAVLVLRVLARSCGRQALDDEPDVRIR